MIYFPSRTGVVLLVLTIIARHPAHAQPDPTTPSLGTIVRSDACALWSDAKVIFESPAHFSEEQWLATAAVVGGTALLFAIDDPIRSFSQRSHSQFNDGLFAVGEQYGREVYGLTLSGALYGGGLLFRNDDIRLTGLTLFESIAIAGAAISAIKVVTGRSRPFLDEGAFRYRGPRIGFETNSLPS